MNLIRQRDALKQMCSDGAFSAHGLEMFLNAPVFEYPESVSFRALSKDEVDFSAQILTNKIHYPFPIFRLFSPTCFFCFTLVQDRKAWRVDNEESHVWAVVFHMTKPMGEPPATPTNIEVKGSLLLRVYLQHPFAVRPRLSTLWVGGKKATEGDSYLDEIQKAVGYDLAALFQRFLIDVMTPSNSIVQVHPQKNNKSVEWRIARTHYVILNNSQARLCQKQSRGPSPQQILRAAHWRRAHFRRLHSEKFTSKKGFVVAVRQAWVGPKEWTGSDKKIYKLVELPNQ